MLDNVTILKKPEFISWDTIHSILLSAHNDKNKEGGMQVTANYLGNELKEKVGNGECFVAMIDGEVIGTGSVSIREHNFWFSKGRLAYFLFDAILPKYQGLGIYSKIDLEREKFVKSLGINVIYTHTSYSNKKMQKIKKNFGYQLVRFSAFSNTNYYSVTLAKWLNKCPFPKWYCFLHYYYSMFRVKLRHRDRG